MNATKQNDRAKRVNLTIPAVLHRRLAIWRSGLNLSAIAARALGKKVEELENKQSSASEWGDHDATIIVCDRTDATKR